MRSPSGKPTGHLASNSRIGIARRVRHVIHDTLPNVVTKNRLAMTRRTEEPQARKRTNLYCKRITPSRLFARGTTFWWCNPRQSPTQKTVHTGPSILNIKEIFKTKGTSLDAQLTFFRPQRCDPPPKGNFWWPRSPVGNDGEGTIDSGASLSMMDEHRSHDDCIWNSRVKGRSNSLRK